MRLKLPAKVKIVAAAASIATWRAILRDGPGIAGAAMVSVGAGEVYAPAMLIVGGVFLLGGSFLAARGRVMTAVIDAAKATQAR